MSGWKGGSTYPIRDTPAHARNKHNTSPRSEPNHLLRRRLCRHEHARDVHLEHTVRILGCILQRWRLLLDACRCDQPVEPPVLGGNVRHYLGQGGGISHVDLAVVEGGAQLVLRLCLELGEFFRGLGQAVQCIDCGRDG